MRLAAAARTRAFGAAALATVLLLVGALGPWTRTRGVAERGIDFNDGWVIVAVAAAAGVFLAVFATRAARWAALGCVACAGLGLAVFAADSDDVFGKQTGGGIAIGGSDVVAPGWGLILVGISSFALAVSAVMIFLRTPPGD